MGEKNQYLLAISNTPTAAATQTAHANTFNVTLTGTLSITQFIFSLMTCSVSQEPHCLAAMLSYISRRRSRLALRLMSSTHTDGISSKTFGEKFEIVTNGLFVVSENGRWRDEQKDISTMLNHLLHGAFRYVAEFTIAVRKSGRHFHAITFDHALQL